MRAKNTNFKFNKKSLKTFKLSDDKNKKLNEDYYSKIILNFFESDKIKEESKNNINNNNNKIKKINKIKLSSNSSNRILKISLNANNKFPKKNNNDINNINNNIGSIVPERKTENLNKKQVTKKIIQSISEKNIIKDNKKNEKNEKNISKSKTNINRELNTNSKKKKENSINSINYNNINNIHNNIIKHHLFINNNHPPKIQNNIINNNNYKEKKNKSLDKRKERKIKNYGDKRNIINLRINVNEMINYKKPSYQINHINKNNKAILNRSLNKRNKKNNNNKKNRSPENSKIEGNNILNVNINYIRDKNANMNTNKTKKINTDINSNSKLNNAKKFKKNTDNNSSKNILDKNNKIINHPRRIIEKKTIKNIISLNLSNSKKNNASKQQMTFKRIKVESIKIDLNSINPQKNNSFISQEKTTAENPILNDKNNLTLRGTEIPKFSKINNKYTELNLVGQTDISDLNRSFKTSFSVNKARSLSKKREEMKRNKLNNLEGTNDEEENTKKLDNILISLSNISHVEPKELAGKSEPKKLIDKIRKFKKLQKLE